VYTNENILQESAFLAGCVGKSQYESKPVFSAEFYYNFKEIPFAECFAIRNKFIEKYGNN
jgi:hypothetical protein